MLTINWFARFCRSLNQKRTLINLRRKKKEKNEGKERIDGEKLKYNNKINEKEKKGRRRRKKKGLQINF